MSHKPFSGVITAIITPFQKNGDVDYVAFNRLLELQKKSGIHGVVVLGTTGENPTLTEEESEKLIVHALEHRSENFHIYVGSGTNNTKQTIEKSKKYSQLKNGNHSVDGVMVVTPYYNKPNAAHLKAHYREVFQSIPKTPVCVYNVPGRTGINMNAKTLTQIAIENPNLVAIKEAAGSLNAITEMRMALNRAGKKDISILSGDDPTFAPALLAGACGVISVTTNFIPQAMLEILSAYQARNVDRVHELHLKTYGINSGIFLVPNPVGIKYVMSLRGLCEGHLRAPLYPAEVEEENQLKSILNELEENKVPMLCL